MADPFDVAVAVRRAPDSPDNPAVYTAEIIMPGPGSATVAIALNAIRAELAHVGSPCSQPISFQAEMLSGVRKGDAVEVSVDKARLGGRFAFLRATLTNMGRDKGKKPTIVATISSVFCAPDRTPKSPPFPAPPIKFVPPRFDDLVSLQELTKKYRKVNPLVRESWDWKVTKDFAAQYAAAEAKAEAEGLDAAGVRRRLTEWLMTLKNGAGGWYYYHLSGRPIDPLSLLLFSDIITPEGFIANNVADMHEKDGFPFLTLSFTVNFMGEVKGSDGLRGAWGRVKYKGDFADMEEREMVMRDEFGRPLCVGRQNAIWRKPLKRPEKL